MHASLDDVRMHTITKVLKCQYYDTVCIYIDKIELML